MMNFNQYIRGHYYINIMVCCSLSTETKSNAGTKISEIVVETLINVNLKKCAIFKYIHIYINT